MVNTNIQGAIPLAGSGFVARRSGDFTRGEYKRLSNVEIIENRLLNRRSVHSVYGDTSNTGTVPLTNPFGFIGNLNDFAVVVSDTEHFAVNGSSKVAMWAPALLTVPAPAGSFHKILGYFRYNYKNYWLTVEFNAGVEVKFRLLHGNISATADIPASYDAAYFAGLTNTTILTIPVADTSFPKLAYRTFFMMNDRLWLVLSTGVYFSKATDPTIFAVPDGGFFKFPDQTINWAMGLSKSVFVLCDNQIDLISYNDDPNSDAFVRLMTDNVGGDHGCIFQDTPVFINQRGIFTIGNGYVTKLMDNEFDVGEDYYSNAITAFEDYLIVNKFIKENYEKFDPSVTSVRTNLIVNPTLTTNFNHFGASDLYVFRTRSNGDYYNIASGVWSHKSEKTNDKTVANRTNHIVNPDFAVDFSNWTGFQSSTGAGLTPTAFAHSADDGGVAKATVVGDRQFSTARVSMLSANINCVPGDDVEVSADVKNGQVGHFVVQYYNGVTLLVQHNSPDFAASSGAYVRRTFEPTVPPATTTHMRVGVEFDVTNTSVPSPVNYTYRVDKFMVEIGRYTLAPTDYFSGASVDTAEFDYQWTGAANASTSVQMGYGGGSIAYVSAVKYTTDYTNVDSNKSYTFGFGHRRTTVPADNSITLLLEIYEYDAGNNLVNTNDIFLTHDQVTDPNWKFFTSTFTTSSTTTKIKWEIRIAHQDFGYGQISYFDAFILETTSTYSGYFDGDSVDNASITYAFTGVANDSTSTATITQFFRKEYKNGRRFIPFRADNALGHCVYFINMTNNAVHVFDYNDSRDTSEKGWPIEFWVNTNKDKNGNYNLFFLTNKLVSEDAASLNLKGHLYYMNSFRDLEFYDYAVNGANSLKKYVPKVLVEIDSYVPDGSEYQMKKFRNLEIMARLPVEDFKMAPGYYNDDYSEAYDLASSYNGSGRPHYPMRIGLNQRARSLSLKFYNETSDVAIVDEEDYGIIEISDIRALWSYTGRGPTVKSAGAVN